MGGFTCQLYISSETSRDIWNIERMGGGGLSTQCACALDKRTRAPTNVVSDTILLGTQGNKMAIVDTC